MIKTAWTFARALDSAHASGRRPSDVCKTFFVCLLVCNTSLYLDCMKNYFFLLDFQNFSRHLTDVPVLCYQCNLGLGGRDDEQMMILEHAFLLNAIECLSMTSLLNANVSQFSGFAYNHHRK